MSWLTEPWQFGFFARGLAAATLAGALCGLVGTYVVLRRMSYIGHGLSHAMFGGAVVGSTLGGNLYVVGGLWGALAALAVNGLARSRKVGADAAIGIVTTASFALGVAILSRGRHFTRNFDAALFGNVLGVTAQDLAVLAVVSAGTVAAVFLLYKQLLFVTFDPDVAATYGVRTGLVDLAFSLLLAAVVIATMRPLGVTLIAAAIVTPAVVARLAADSFGPMLLLSTAVGAVTGAVGMYLSYHLDVGSGATVTLTAAALFVLAYAASGLRSARRRGLSTRPGSRRPPG